MQYPAPPSLLAISLALVACAGCGDPAGPNPGAPSVQLLLNGDMEDTSVWWRGGNSTSRFVYGRSNTEASSGARSLSLSDIAGSTGFFSFWAQTLPVGNVAGMTLELSVEIKTSDVRGEGIALAIRGDDQSLRNADAEAWATTRDSILIQGTQEWTRYSVQLSDLEATIDRVTVYLMFLPNTSGIVYFDDAVLSSSPSS